MLRVELQEKVHLTMFNLTVILRSQLKSWEMRCKVWVPNKNDFFLFARRVVVGSKTVFMSSVQVYFSTLANAPTLLKITSKLWYSQKTFADCALFIL